MARHFLWPRLRSFILGLPRGPFIGLSQEISDTCPGRWCRTSSPGPAAAPWASYAVRRGGPKPSSNK